MAELDNYGGTQPRRFESNGFFRLEHAPDRWWLVDPAGGGFVTIGGG